MNLHSIVRDDTFLNERQFVENTDSLGRSIDSYYSYKILERVRLVVSWNDSLFTINFVRLGRSIDIDIDYLIILSIERLFTFWNDSLPTVNNCKLGRSIITFFIYISNLIK